MLDEGQFTLFLDFLEVQILLDDQTRAAKKIQEIKLSDDGVKEFDTE